MKLKRFENFNELNEGDSTDKTDLNNGYNILTENVKKATKELLELIQEHVNDPMTMFENDELSDISNNQFTLKVKLFTEQEFTNYIIDEFNDFQLKYGNDIVSISVHKRIDSNSTMLLFEDGDNKFNIPLITTISNNDMIYDSENIVKYEVWLNTYVANKK